MSGTHPRDMLYTDPLAPSPTPSPDEPRRWTMVYRRPPVHDQAEAFHWGGVTSGTPFTAFWLLLLPFALLNTAGWMPAARAHRPVFVAALRLAGLMLTAVFVIQGVTIAIDLPWQGLGGEPIHPLLGWAFERPQLAGTMLALGALTLFGLLTRVASRSHFERQSTAWKRVWDPRLSAMAPDPAHAGDYSLSVVSPSSDEMWSRHANPERLTRLHVSLGVTLIGAVMAAAAAGGIVAAPDTPSGIFTLGLLVVIMAATVMAGWATGASLIDRLIAWLPLISLITTALGLGAFLTSDAQPNRGLAGLNDLGFIAVVVLAVAVIVVFLAGWSTRPASLIVIGSVIGGGLGAGLSMASEQILGLDGALPNGLGWFAAASLYGALLLAVVIGLLATLRSRSRQPLQAMRELVPEARTIFNVVFVATVGVMAAVISLRKENLFATRLPPIDDFPELAAGALALYLAATALFVLAFLRMRRTGWSLAVLAASALLLLGLRLGIPHTEILGVPLDLGTFPSVAAAVSVLLPASFIVIRILGGLRNQDRRRGVGILWDLAGMWPRWYHPFAPPPYGPRVVSDLAEELEGRLDNGPLVVAAHSQGSVLAAVVASRLDSARRRHLALITYGSPLHSLYGRFFPVHFNPDWTADLARELSDDQGTRWRNLWRDTDPIGGPIAGVARPDPIEGRSQGHSRYEHEAAYDEEREHLQALLD